jgi:hypothetical protein
LNWNSKILKRLQFVRTSGKLLVIICAVHVFRPLGHAAETNDLVVTNTFFWEIPPTELSSEPYKRYEQELNKHHGVVADKFGPLADLEWTRRLNREAYGIHDHFNSSGANAMGHLIGDSARDTAVALLPIEEWKGFGQLLMGSLGNTAEERTETTSFSYSESERSWREDVDRNRILRYGVRLFRRDPYGYFGLRAGHWGGLEDLPFFVLEGRVGYKAFNAGKLEGRVTFPLTGRFQIVGGVSTDPLRFADHPTIMSGRFEFVCGKNGRTKIMYAGAQSSAHETLLATGVIFAW